VSDYLRVLCLNDNRNHINVLPLCPYKLIGLSTSSLFEWQSEPYQRIVFVSIYIYEFFCSNDNHYRNHISVLSLRPYIYEFFCSNDNRNHINVLSLFPFISTNSSVRMTIVTISTYFLCFHLYLRVLCLNDNRNHINVLSLIVYEFSVWMTINRIHINVLSVCP